MPDINWGPTGELVWKDIPGWDGYQVSNYGEVRSWRGRGKSGTRTVPILLSGGVNRYGYREYKLSRRGLKTHFTGGQLVLMGFVGPRPDNLVACHNNGDPHDNRVENVRWDTQASNMADKLTHGTMPCGERHPNSKLTDAEASVVKRLKGHVPVASVARALGLAPAQITRIWKGKSYIGNV